VFQRGFDGIHYRSKYGHDIWNWALFEPFKLSPKDAEAIDLADPELVRALAIHRCKWGRVSRRGKQSVCEASFDGSRIPRMFTS
jgi:hypothetical protein